MRAATLLKELDPASRDVDAQIRPAPTRVPAELNEAPRLIEPAGVAAGLHRHRQGTIQIELAVLDAPLTVANFVALARKGFFNGAAPSTAWCPNFVVQDGDPRGDGEGGPGYTIRDEINERPVSARHRRHGARLGRHRRQPVLHHALTAAASRRALHRVRPRRRRHGVVDRIQQWDVIRGVRVWDGHADDAAESEQSDASESDAAVVGEIEKGATAPPFIDG